ncbi:Uncharacterised protein [Vibrio cholerae]|nr:Uncharacterised protein [Vibrio cholerae]
MRSEARRLFKVRNRQNARHDFYVNPSGHTAIAKTQVAFYIKEKLRDGTIRTCIDFTF